MDDRLALRLGLLHLARQRRSLSRAAWSAARLRLEGVRLDSGDARYAHEALVRFGRAIRLSRARRDHETGHELTPMNFSTAGVPWGRRAVARALVAASALVALLVAFLLYGAPAGLGDRTTAGGSTPVTGSARAAASPLRGRSQQFVAVLPVPTPAPTAKPDGTGAGGSGLGTVGGTGAGTGSGAGAGTGTGAGVGAGPAPTQPPTVMILYITVTDASSRIGLPGVCVIEGSTTCANAPLTDEMGNAIARLSVGQLWRLEFKRTGYATQQVEVLSDVPSRSIAIALVPLR